MNFITPEMPVTSPTICGPISDFRELTTVSNAYTLGWYGYACGILTAGLFFVAVYYVAPRVYIYGSEKGWWV